MSINKVDLVNFKVHQTYTKPTPKVHQMGIFVRSEQTATLPGVNSRLGRSKGLDYEVGHFGVLSVPL